MVELLVEEDRDVRVLTPMYLAAHNCKRQDRIYYLLSKLIYLPSTEFLVAGVSDPVRHILMAILQCNIQNTATLAILEPGRGPFIE